MNKKKIVTIFSQTALVIALLFGNFSLAHADANCDTFFSNFKFTNSTGGTDNTVESLPKVCSAQDAILLVINYGLAMAGTVAVLFIIVGGFWYLTSAGDEEQAEKGRKVITNAVIGLVVIIMAYTIVRVVSSTLH